MLSETAARPCVSAIGYPQDGAQNFEVIMPVS